MKNRIFQFIWFYIFKGLFPRKKGVGTTLSDYADRMTDQIQLANAFGKIDFIILGDSNGENLATYSNMVQLGKSLGLGINIAIGGTRADSWVDFLLYSEKGQFVEITTTI